MSGTIFCLRKSNEAFSFSTQVTKLLILKSANILRMYTNKKAWDFTIQGFKNSVAKSHPKIKQIRYSRWASCSSAWPTTLWRWEGPGLCSGQPTATRWSSFSPPRLAQSCPLRSGLVVAVDSLRLIFPVILFFSVYWRMAGSSEKSLQVAGIDLWIPSQITN